MNSLITDIHPYGMPTLVVCVKQKGVSKEGGGVGSNRDLGGGKAALVVLSISIRKKKETHFSFVTKD